jgi:hypothetical protein
MWKIYKYVKYTPITDSTTMEKETDLLEEYISEIDFMKKFKDQIYRYVKHSHTMWW